MTSSKSWYLGFVVGFALVNPTAFANEPTPLDAQAVVSRQLEAFERDDAADAWRLAAPEVQAQFQNAQNYEERMEVWQDVPAYELRTASLH